ncbi:endonuclease domain-containing protein [bacterium]|jgi:very-short-patch-repair endonuclease|nr:endonuclease domain-containing protein [bacterium]
MRNQLLRLTKVKSTKGERRIGEIFKRNRIKFKTKYRIGKYVVDFLVGRTVIEVDGNIHKHTDTHKDIFLFSQGYVPIHISSYVKQEIIEKQLINLIESNKYGRNR